MTDPLFSAGYQIGELYAKNHDLQTKIDRMMPVFNAAVTWQEIGSLKGMTHHDTNLALGYLYDRVRIYKQKYDAIQTTIIKGTES